MYSEPSLSAALRLDPINMAIYGYGEFVDLHTIGIYTHGDENFERDVKNLCSSLKENASDVQKGRSRSPKQLIESTENRMCTAITWARNPLGVFIALGEGTEVDSFTKEFLGVFNKIFESDAILSIKNTNFLKEFTGVNISALPESEKISVPLDMWHHIIKMGGVKTLIRLSAVSRTFMTSQTLWRHQYCTEFSAQENNLVLDSWRQEYLYRKYTKKYNEMKNEIQKK